MNENEMSPSFYETLGAPLAPNDARDYRAKVATAALYDYPEHFDLFENMGIGIKNQMRTGSCVAHALATTIEYFHRKQEESNVEMSTGYIYGNRQYTVWQGTGLYVRDALKTVAKCGDAFWNDMPNNLEMPHALKVFNARDSAIDQSAYHNRISSYYRLNDINSMKEQLMHVGPIIIAVNWHPYKVDKNGILTWTNEKEKRGGHCMVIRGWTKDGWLVQNSWGRLWGTGGLCIIPYDMKLREIWGVCDNVVGETGNLVVKRANWFKRTFYKVINLFWQIVYCFKKKENS